MNTLLRTALLPHIASSALKVSLVVGTILNAINQGDSLIHGDPVSWFHVACNYIVPYCVASYSAAKSQLARNT